MAGKYMNFTNQQFTDIILQSRNCAEAMRKMGYHCTTGGSHKAILERIHDLGLDTSHWQKGQLQTIKYSDEEYYVKNSVRGSGLKRRILKDHKIEYKCALCGNNGQWRGYKISLHLDHINGDHLDNRLENLRFLCPNCHAQTETYSGKNVKHNKKIITKEKKTPNRENTRKVFRPTGEQILEELKISNMSAVGKKYGVSDKAVAKWLKYYGLPSTIKDLKALNLI